MAYYQSHTEQTWSNYLRKSAVGPRDISGAYLSLGLWSLSDNREVELMGNLSERSHSKQCHCIFYRAHGILQLPGHSFVYMTPRSSVST